MHKHGVAVTSAHYCSKLGFLQVSSGDSLCLPAFWSGAPAENSPQRETERETYAGGLRDQCQPEGIVGHFLCFVPSSYVTQKCSDRLSYMRADREMENE